MNNYRQIGTGSAFELVDWRGERVWIAKGSLEYDEYLEEGIRSLMVSSPPRSLASALRQPDAATTVRERRVTLALSAQWKGNTRIVRQVELRETITIERFD
jgi:hypothetical protein